MDRNLRIRMLLEAGDRASRPLRDIANGGARAAAELKTTRDRLKDMERAQADIASFRQLRVGLRATDQSLRAAQARVAQLSAEIEQSAKPTRAMKRDLATATREVDTLTRHQQVSARHLAEVGDKLRAAGIGTTGLGRHNRELRSSIVQVNGELAEQTRRLEQVAARQRRFGDARAAFDRGQARATGLAAGGAAGIVTARAAAQPLIMSAQGAMTLEEGMAGVAKVTGLSDRALTSLAGRVVDLSTKIPMTAAELANIAAAAGAAGVGMDKFGKPLPSQADDLLAFTDAAARMGIAFDMEAEEAGGTMAKWRQAFQLPQAEIELLGDRVNALTNKFGGKAPAVTAVITRIGALGKVAGLSTPLVAALASSLISIGVEEEIAATGIKNMMLTMTKGEAATKSQSAAFKTLGLDAVQVSKRMQRDAGGAIIDILTRIRRLTPDRQASLLDSLFGSESIGAIAPLLTNLDGLQQRVALVGDKSAYAGSMTQEFLSRINTTKGATDLAANAFQAVNIALGQTLLPSIREGAMRFGAMALRMRAFATRHPEIAKGAMMAAGTLAIVFAVIGVGSIVIAGIMGPIAIMNAGLIAMGVAGGIASVGLLPIIGTIAAIAGALAIGFAVITNWDAIWAFLRTLPGRFAAFGGDIVLGLIGGMFGYLGRLKNAVMGIGSRVADWFKQKLGIRSPSRVFAGFGGYMMAGLDGGIAHGQAAPIQRIDRLSRRLTAGMAIGAISSFAAPPASADISADRLSITGAPGGGRRDAGSATTARAMPAPLPPMTFNIYPPAGASPQDIGLAVRAEWEKLMRGQARPTASTFLDDPDWT